MSSRRIHALTYRVEGIPADTSRSEVKDLFYKEDQQHIEVKSLCASVDDAEGELTATVLFRNYEQQSHEPRVQNSDIQIDKEFRGFTPLHVPLQDKCEIAADIIAVTGLAGHAFGSWAHSEDRMWLRDYLPKIADNARILTYGYDSKLVNSSSFSTLRDYTNRFLTGLVSMRRTCEGRARPIIFVGHSLGCIIIKKAMTDFESVGLSRLPVRTIIFLACPHRGLENTALRSLVKEKPSKKLVEELSFDSTTLMDINERFKSKVQGVHILGFYEQKTTKTVIQNENGEWTRDGPPVMMVDQNSALLGLQNETAIPADCNHSEIAKVKRGQGGIYPLIISAVQEGLRSTVDVVSEATKKADSREYNPNLHPKSGEALKRSKSRRVPERRHLSRNGDSVHGYGLRPRAMAREQSTTSEVLNNQDYQINNHSVDLHKSSHRPNPVLPNRPHRPSTPTNAAPLHTMPITPPLSDDCNRKPCESGAVLTQGSGSPFVDAQARSDLAPDASSDQLTMVDEDARYEIPKTDLDKPNQDTTQHANPGSGDVACSALPPSPEEDTSYACKYCEVLIKRFDFHFQCETCIEGGDDNYHDDGDRYHFDNSDNSDNDSVGGANTQEAFYVCPNCQPTRLRCPKHSCVLRKFVVKRQSDSCRFVPYVEPKVLRSDNDLVSAIKRNHLDDLRRAAQNRRLFNTCNSDGSSPIHLAAQLGRAECTRVLLESRIKKDGQNYKGNTPLMEAIEYDQPDVVRLLLDHGVDVEKLNEHAGLTALGMAAQWGLSDIVEMLLQRNATIEHTGMESLSPLFLAVIGKDKESVRLLVHAGANLNTKSEYDGETPLHEAASEGHVGIAQMSLAAGAAVNETSFDGSTALHCSAAYDHPEMTKILLEAGADPSIRDNDGRTALQAAVIFDNEAPLQALLDAGANVRIKDDEDGNTPLHDAVISGDPNIVAVLLSNGAAIDRLNYESQTALHLAAANLEVEMTKILLSAGANVNLQDGDGNTPLHVAAENNSIGMVDLLLKYGSDLKTTNYAGRTPLLLAASLGQPALCRKLLQARANPNCADENGITPLHLAVIQDSTDVIDLLLRHNCNLERTDNLGHTPLITAAYLGHTQSCHILLHAGARTEAKRPEDNKTALFLACEGSHLDTVLLLMEHEADADHRDAQGNTCLCVAAREGSLLLCRILLEHGAYVDMEGDEFEDTALNIASWIGHSAIVEVLLDFNAGPQKTGSRGDFPLFAAASGGHIEACEVLLRAEIDIDQEVLYDPCGNWTGMNAVSIAAGKGNILLLDFLLEHGASGQPPTALEGKWKNQPFADDVPEWVKNKILERLREAKRTSGGRRSSKLRMFGR